MTAAPCVVDTSAWIEWLADTRLGKRLGRQFPDKPQWIVPTIVQLELSKWLNIIINDRFGHPVQPQGWFLVPLFVVDEAVERIKDGAITNYVYDPKAARLVKAVSASRAKKEKSG